MAYPPERRVWQAAKRGGQTKTRAAKREPGCIKQVANDVIRDLDVIGEESVANISAEEANPTSTVLIVRAEVRIVLHVVALCFLTLLAGSVCWAKRNHAFSDCQQPRRFFFRAASRNDPAAAAARIARERTRASTRSQRVRDDIAETRATLRFQRDRFFIFLFSIDARAHSRTRRRRSARPVSEEKIPFREGPKFRVAQARLRESARTFFGREGRSTTTAHARGGSAKVSNAVFAVAVRRARRHRRACVSASLAARAAANAGIVRPFVSRGRGEGARSDRLDRSRIAACRRRARRALLRKAFTPTRVRRLRASPPHARK